MAKTQHCGNPKTVKHPYDDKKLVGLQPLTETCLWQPGSMISINQTNGFDGENKLSMTVSFSTCGWFSHHSNSEKLPKFSKSPAHYVSFLTCKPIIHGFANQIRWPKQHHKSPWHKSPLWKIPLTSWWISPWHNQATTQQHRKGSIGQP